MVAQRWKNRSLIKQATGRLLVVAVCVSVSGIWCVCVTLRSRADNLSGSLAQPVPLKRSRLINVSLDISFRSPFIVADWNQEMAAALANRVTTTDTTIRKFAVIWPCKGSQIGCFTDTRFPVRTCSFSRCRQTWSLEEADVVVFYVFRIKRNEGVPKFNRPRHQRWVMLTPEAPTRGREFAMLDFPALKGQFNWTQSYRLDSDIPTIYGKLKRIEAPEKNYDKIVHGKTTTAAWFVSHCDTPSQRQQYVERMQLVADIHVYGSCGNYTCKDDYHRQKRVLDKDKCLPLLSKFYFFYLAFENSLCKDYVTEKFFKTFGDIDVIPVVRGGADYKRFFPVGTFIDTADFRSPEELAQFLINLSRDKGRYVRMLKEKSRYALLPLQRWFCGLCEKMHQDEIEKSYHDLRKWYVQDQCHDPTDM